MKEAIVSILGCSLVVPFVAASAAGASDPIAEKILKLYPQADTDGDGVLSSAEEAALSRMVLKRFPQADADRDGVLSDAEKQTSGRSIKTGSPRSVVRQVRKSACGWPSATIWQTPKTKP